MASKFVSVPFRSKSIICLKVSGRVYVDLAPPCEWFGLDYRTWVAKLSDPRNSWVESLESYEDSSGRRQGCFLVSQATLLGWLGMIDSTQVADSSRRQFLNDFKRECNDVLNRHFSGETTQQGPVPPVTPAEQALAMAQAIVDQERQISETRQIALAAEQTASAVLHSVGQCEDFVQIVGFLKMYGYRDKSEDDCREYGRMLASLCRVKGHKIHPTAHRRWGTTNAYPVEILHGYFEDVIGISLTPNDVCAECRRRRMIPARFEAAGK